MLRIPFILLLLTGSSLVASSYQIVDDSPQLQFGLTQLQAAIDDKSVDVSVEFAEDAELGEQAFQIKSDGGTIKVQGGDALGLMYATQELAERIRMGDDPGELAVDAAPFIKRRGLKMNIPLDARWSEL